MGLFRAYFRDDMAELVERDVRMRVIGNRNRADDDILRMIEDGERRTVGNKGLNLVFAFDYGAQEEIANAARALAKAAAKGELDPANITPEYVRHRFAPAACPIPIW